MDIFCLKSNLDRTMHSLVQPDRGLNPWPLDDHDTISCHWDAFDHTAVSDFTVQKYFTILNTFTMRYPWGDKVSMLNRTYLHKGEWRGHLQAQGWQPILVVAWCLLT